MTAAEQRDVQNVINSPGWKTIVKYAQQRIEKAKLEALVNTDEKYVLTLWHRANAAFDILQDFLTELESQES